ncbi:radical SAM protein [Candidatus Bathyarchaeota archaeon]|nr:radical SAM protein [Candidatus Bathyarchaeota archaeon]
MIGPGDFVDEYVVLPFRQGKLEDKFLVTTDAGSWALLTNRELDLLNAHRVETDARLFASLRAAGIVVTEQDFPDVKARMKDRLWHLTKGTSLHVLAVTDDCNFACKYCYANTKGKQKMSVDTAEKVVDFVMQSPAETVIIEFSGGEPLLNFEAIKAAVEKARPIVEKNGKGLGFAMIHNGTNWDEEKVRFFMDNHIGVCFSLDGPEDLHNIHRPYRVGGGSYKDVVRWIRRFQREGYPGLNALPVITRHSLSRGKDIVDEYLSHGFNIVRFKYLSYFGRAPALWKEIGYTPEEFVKAWKDVLEYMYELNNRGIDVKENITQVMARKLFSRLDPGFCELQMPCGAGLSQLAYAPDGSVYTCDEGRMFEEFRIGDVSMSYPQVMKSSVLQGLSMSSSGLFNLCDSCELKPFCGICPLETYNRTGSIDAKIAFDRRHKMHREMLRYLIKRASKDGKFRQMLENWARSTEKRQFYFGAKDIY